MFYTNAIYIVAWFNVMMHDGFFFFKMTPWHATYDDMLISTAMGNSSYTDIKL